ncbi:unnamed protein product [Gongylonema pulchrum]|uniref:Triacylglycerol lipase n=1 Tax=Gongylonema pulchrum TaxID=637853 RepID=A0A183EEK2_9BILA|nr:unnamed protein product [Gongylonema pulchrum]
MLLIILLLFRTIYADFTPHFRAFIHNNYGVAIAQMLERTDLSMDASFGGKLDDEDELNNQGVILIHGIGNKITRFQGMVKHLLSKGYKQSEIYGTTWGDAGATPAALVDMKCSYVKQIRSMIIAVRQYTGPPLTELIDTYLSVAGANYGSVLCIVPIPVGTCNRRTGLHCKSTFLQDINAQTRYEGTFIFSIFSDGDEKIGFRACDTLLSPIKGETGFVKKEFLSHDLTMDSTYEMQRNFIQKQRPI